MKRRIGMIVLAIVLALVGTVAVYSYAHNADKRAVDAIQSTTVLYANKKIPAGTKWSDAVSGTYFTKEQVPVDAAPSTAVADTAESPISANEVATADIAAGQIVVRQMFGTKAPTTSGLQIPGNLMATSVKLTADADVAGYVQPGSEVAIFDTFIMLDDKGTPAGTPNGAVKTDNWATKLLLPRVQVLAVSQGAPSGTHSGLGNSNSGTPQATLLVTVAVSQHDAERLIQVASSGNLYLSLLSSHSASAPAPGVDNQAKLGPVFAK